MRKLIREPLIRSFAEGRLEAGCDEAGRGCLAGPVFAAAVILPTRPSAQLAEMLDDSKQLTVQKRNKLRLVIENEAQAFGVAMVDAAMVDKINVLKASIKAMHLALEKLPFVPHFIVVDGNRFKPYNDIPHACIVKADATFMHVAAASILAKTWRDAYMQQLHEEFPHYGWDKNKGYPTPAHLKALNDIGPSPYHRLTFGPVHQLRFPFP